MDPYQWCKSMLLWKSTDVDIVLLWKSRELKMNKCGFGPTSIPFSKSMDGDVLMSLRASTVIGERPASRYPALAGPLAELLQSASTESAEYRRALPDSRALAAIVGWRSASAIFLFFIY